LKPKLSKKKALVSRIDYDCGAFARALWQRIHTKTGWDKIGRRRLDTHFEGFINLGAKFRYNREDHFYGVEAADGLVGPTCFAG
jgi:UDP-N-acetylglucosamine enolpyruvyl transferase